jgi:cbb3-type cytochrome oxidase cytochrome c subunit/cytochrome c553
MNFHVDHRLLYGTAFGGFIVLTLIIAIFPAFRSIAVEPTPGLQPLTPLEAQGREIYISEGCSYCHTQQLRPVPHDRLYGRPAAAGDYAYSTPQLLGTARTGPDLSDIGNRQPDETWHLVHLYQPRAVVAESVMPTYTWHFEVKDRAEPGETVVPVPPSYAPAGKVVVAGRDALALLAYLLSLRQPKLDMTAFAGEEAPAAAAPSGPAPPGDLRALGTQVYGAHCARCHGMDGAGTPGLYPPLKGSATVNDRDYSEHVRIVLSGLAGQAIGGREYAGNMPPFADVLTDQEIAAVVLHERTSWGNEAEAPMPEDVRRLRAGP